MRRPRMLGGEAIVLVVVVSMALVAGCVSGDRDDPVGRPRPSTVGTAHDDPPAPESAGGPALLPGMPPPLDPGDVYAADRPGMLSAAVRGAPASSIRITCTSRRTGVPRWSWPSGSAGWTSATPTPWRCATR